ncbi:Hypothetical predicted protein [Mytilus galloprovincialis]|uniref:F5/8 type C domain-containing protein n=1 Tax=Mytilus galloprovincialis TaxID=29158 RepID=A0A8B6HHN4_MYTGA|nr:Hypothetical predicted protein [Mytilus galloprovincialis]
MQALQNLMKVNVTNVLTGATFDEGGWAASVYDSFQYLKIDLEGLWEITSITNKDISRWSWYHTQSFRILHSKDGLTWTAYNTYLSDEILGETFNRQNTLTTIQFNPTIKTRFIVFNPVRYNWRPSMRVELYGCKRHDVASNDISTIVETNIESDTVWIPSQSPVIIDRHISIRPLATLTIQAGVSVIFTSSDAGIDVYGTLRVNGLEAVETIFTSSFPVLSKKRQWKGIFHQPGGNISLWYTVVRQATIGIQGDSIGIHLGHCNIYSCDTGIQLSGGTTSKHKISDSTFTILHTRSFRNEYGIRLHGTAQLPYIYIDQSQFSFNSKHGLVIENWNDESSSDTVLHLYNSKLNDNYKSGLLSSCSYQKHILVIENSSFSRNGETGLYLYQYYYEPTTVFDISYSNFEENAYNGVEYKYICYYCHGNLSNSLRHNHMIHNKRFQIVFSFTNRDDKPVMMNVLLTNNTIRKHSYYERYAVSIGANRVIGVFEIVNNTFDDLRGGFGINSGQDSSVQVNMINNIFENIYGEQMAVLYISSTRLHFVENIISNCSVNNLVDLVDGLSHQIKNNSFNNNAVTYCIVRVGEEYNKIKSINADFNYWGTDNISLVKACICDVFLDSLKARVRTDYVFLDPSMTSAQHIPTVDDFHITFDTDFNAYVIGGVIKSLINLPTFESDTVIVNRTVIIDYSAEVHLFGITYNFTAKRGIIVLGMLWLIKYRNMVVVCDVC